MHNSEIFTLAQLTDVHLGPIPPFWPRHWNLKRALGYMNFCTKRRHFNDPTLVRMLVADLKQQAFDHIAVTGDLANIGMPAEFVQSLEWLKTVGTPEEVTVVPGNHDIYAPLLTDPGVERWRPYMRARDGQDDVTAPPPLSTGFPFVRTFGRFALICLNSAVPTPPLVASGVVGKDQLLRFAEISRALHGAGYARIVLIHHPPLPERGPRGLRDAAAVERTLIDVGADLVLHGHNHRAMISWRDTATGPLPIVGAGAAGDGVYNLCRIERQTGGACRIAITIRAAVRPGSPVAEISQTVLDPAIAARQQII